MNVSGLRPRRARQSRQSAGAPPKYPVDYVKLLKSFRSSSRWIHRRVETIDYSDPGATRLRVSLDLTIPDEWFDLGMVPLGLVNKRVLSSLDVTDASGRSLSVLTTNQNGRLATRLLEASAGGVLDGSQQVRDIVFFRPSVDGVDDTDILMLPLARALETMPQKAARSVSRLARLFLTGFLFVVMLPEDVRRGSRCVFKFSYIVEQPRLARLTHEVFQPVEVNWSAGTHVEIRPPAGATFKNLALVALAPAGVGHVEVIPFPAQATRVKRPTVGHLVAKRPRHRKEVYAEFELVARRGGLVLAALIASIFTLGVTGFVAYDHWAARGWLAAAPDGAASALLLLGPAVLLTLLSERSEHRLVRQVLIVPRLAVMLDAAVLFVGACVAAGVVTSDLRWTIWNVATLLSAGILTCFVWWFWAKTA